MDQHAPGEVDPATDSTELLRIGEAADRVGLSIRTLRHWHDVELVTPTARSKGGFRLYSTSDLRRLLVVKSMKPMGLTLEEMADLLELVEDATAANEGGRAVRRVVAERLAQYAARTVERIERIERDHRDASVLLDRINTCLAFAPDRRSASATQASPRVDTC